MVYNIVDVLLRSELDSLKFFGLFLIISMLTRNPLLALLILIIIFVFIDRSFIGMLPDFLAPLRRRRRRSELQREVVVNPHDANAQLALGEMYFMQGRYDRAVERLQNALVKMEDSALGRYYLGASLYYLGQKEQSLKELAAAIQINPKVAHGLPYLYLLKHSYSESLTDSLLRYGSVQALFETGKYLKQIGKKQEAAKFFNEVLDVYRLSSPTMRRNYRRMAVYARLFGK
ncbi:Tetratricopeptide repeat-containing protein [Desulfotomaculum arcticum]|uniref:Tetratricopeptide repeat-containing protein n=1 Tax=Desulfotruncus arcticus DSM 17038 TaxID=1121424 RepID=A0A1I2T0R9_9FIRM|nr:Tetratricopeptide repeat-containing protein [Desulfotomaculum arcticum] [Desulfotruncus arcticus DSM 17038]